MNILVTGGAGYIGSHACKILAQNGYTPVTYDNLINGHRWAVKWGPLEEGDIQDRERLQEVFQKYKPEAVMHFAAFAYVGESVEVPDKYYRNNICGTLTLLEAMRDDGIDKIIFSSSCAIYGIPEEVPITEKHPHVPMNPYGVSKFTVEKILKGFDDAYGLRSISLRYFNAAGADPEGEIGEVHNPETHLIPLILEVASGHRPYIPVYGDDYETRDGTCVRDYIHVTDLANAHLSALQALEQGMNTTAYNLGNGKGYSVKEVIEAAQNVTSQRISNKVASRRLGDPPELVADAGMAIEKLNWKPSITNISDIIDTAWRWHTNLKNK